MLTLNFAAVLPLFVLFALLVAVRGVFALIEALPCDMAFRWWVAYVTLLHAVAVMLLMQSVGAGAVTFVGVSGLMWANWRSHVAETRIEQGYVLLAILLVCGRLRGWL